MKTRIFLSPPHLFGEERALVDEAFASNYIAPCGPMVDRFEHAIARRAGVASACALSSCTAALDLLFHELNICEGDTVFCSSLSFVASVSPAVHRGARPVFVGSERKSWTISPIALEQALDDARRSGKLPRAVVAVDLYGQCCDYDVIESICARHGVPLIVDSAEALGAVYGKRSAGNAGWAAVYSFNGNKIVTSSGGGVLLSNDTGLVQRAAKRSQQSREPAIWYEHVELGYNYRMSNVVAAIGLGQLMNLDRIVSRKRHIFETYRACLGDLDGVSFMPEAGYGRCSRWLTVATLPGEVGDGARPSARVLRVIDALERENVEARPVWKPLHLQPVFRGCRAYGADVDEALFSCGICLPSGTGLGDGDIERISGIVRRAL